MKPLILCPVHGRIEPDVNELFSHLRFVHGWDYQAWHGGIGVDRVRSQMASFSLQSPNEYVFWCDDDNVISLPEVLDMYETVKSKDLDVLVAVVPLRRMKILANFVPLDPDETIMLGPEGGLHKARYAGLAMAFTHRRVWERMAAAKVKKCPCCNAKLKKPMPLIPEVDYIPAFTEQKFKGWPFFWPVVNAKERQHYGEDYSVCERIRQAGMTIWVDTRKVAIHLSDTTPRTLQSIMKQQMILDRINQEEAYREAVVF